MAGNDKVLVKRLIEGSEGHSAAEWYEKSMRERGHYGYSVFSGEPGTAYRIVRVKARGNDVWVWGEVDPEMTKLLGGKAQS